jgi:hypothetical protein
MSARIERPAGAALAGAGGALVMLGAWLPWLTLFAGLQAYGGLIGLHGRILFGGGVLATIAGIAMVRTRRVWIQQATILLGCCLLGFDGWLLAGLLETLHRGDAMLVPRPGPGLFVALLGITLVLLGPAIALTRYGADR